MTKTFPRFSDLPPEIRHIIWGYTACVERRVDIWLNREWPTIPGDLRWTSRTPVPSILHTSVEAREIGLKFYKAAFMHAASPALTYPATEIYVNFDYDILCPIGFTHFTQCNGRERKSWWAEAAGIRRVALSARYGDVFFHRHVVPQSVEEIILYWMDYDGLDEVHFYHPEPSRIKPRIRASYSHIGFADFPKTDVSTWMDQRLRNAWQYLTNFEAILGDANQYNLREAASHEDPQKFLDNFFIDLDHIVGYEPFDFPETNVALRKIKEDLEKQQPNFQWNIKIMTVNGRQLVRPLPLHLRTPNSELKLAGVRTLN